jgi:hypothetical protein
MANKQIKFDSNLVPLVLSGEKITTWRLWDDKNLSVGDIVDFIDRGTGQQFVTAELVKVIEKSIKDLTPEDQVGHEKYETVQEICETFSRYYKQTVTPDDKVKIIWFKLA